MGILRNPTIVSEDNGQRLPKNEQNLFKTNKSGHALSRTGLTGPGRSETIIKQAVG